LPPNYHETITEHEVNTYLIRKLTTFLIATFRWFKKNYKILQPLIILIASNYHLIQHLILLERYFFVFWWMFLGFLKSEINCFWDSYNRICIKMLKLKFVLYCIFWYFLWQFLLKLNLFLVKTNNFKPNDPLNFVVLNK